jgi:hypothetical protein
MSKKIWSIEEEIILCEIYLEKEDTFIETAEITLGRLNEAGYTGRTRKTVQAKLRDYCKIHNKKDTSHCAPKSIRVYEILTSRKHRMDDELESFISKLYNPNGTDDEIISFDTFGVPSIITKFVFNEKQAKITETFDDYLLRLMGKYKKPSEIYNPAGRANTAIMSRQDFSKIVNGSLRTYDNILKLAILMKLDYNTTLEFMGTLGYTLKTNELRYLIIFHAIKTGHYDHMDIDITLYEHKCKMLFQ